MRFWILAVAAAALGGSESRAGEPSPRGSAALSYLAPVLGLDVSITDWMSARGTADLAVVFRRDRFDERYQEVLSSFRLGLAFHAGG